MYFVLYFANAESPITVAYFGPRLFVTVGQQKSPQLLTIESSHLLTLRSCKCSDYAKIDAIGCVNACNTDSDRCGKTTGNDMLIYGIYANIIGKFLVE